jgi:hypothetical protein
MLKTLKDMEKNLSNPIRISATPILNDANSLEMFKDRGIVDSDVSLYQGITHKKVPRGF